MAWQLLSGIFSSLSLFCLLPNFGALFFVHAIIGRGLPCCRHLPVLHMGPFSSHAGPKEGTLLLCIPEFWRVNGFSVLSWWMEVISEFRFPLSMYIQFLEFAKPGGLLAYTFLALP